jgi:hypothetical protein
MRGFRDPKRTQKFFSCCGLIRQHFALKWHLLRASLFRKQLAAWFVAWREFAEFAQNRRQLSDSRHTCRRAVSFSVSWQCRGESCSDAFLRHYLYSRH